MRAYRVASVLGVFVLVAAALTAVTSPATARPSSATTSPVQPRISLSSTNGPPISRVRVSGAGFRASERVDIYLDRTDVVFTIFQMQEGV